MADDTDDVDQVVDDETLKVVLPYSREGLRLGKREGCSVCI